MFRVFPEPMSRRMTTTTTEAVTFAAKASLMPRARADRRRPKQADLGPSVDPIRQQGRDPMHVYNPAAWFTTVYPSKLPALQIVGNDQISTTAESLSGAFTAGNVWSGLALGKA